ncbi:MAG: hypothetical protein NC321_03265 [Clostridium sp.]|nr:hypothetical protein [Clostridium sp.]
MKPRMNVYLTTAKRVLYYAYPVIWSLFEKNQDSEIYLYLVSENLEESDIIEEKKLAERYGNHIIILHFDEKMAKGKIVSASDHWPLGTLGCYWMFHELLPKEVDRILAIESDAVVTGSLREFYDTDLTGFYAACPDAEHKPLAHRRLMERLGGDVLTFVVSLYDVQAIRQDFTLEQILEADRRAVEEFGHSQQELTFGILFRNKIKFLPAPQLCVEENIQSMTAMGYDYLMACEKTCKVLHFSSTKHKEKPWNPTYIMPGYYEWWKYAHKSPYYKAYFESQWENYECRENEIETLKKNISYRNILLVILLIYTVLVVLLGIVLADMAVKQPLVWVAAVLGAFIIASGMAVFIRRISIRITNRKGK